MAIMSRPAAGLRMKSIEQFVVTESALGPIIARRTAYIARSASANIAGPETVPPGRKCLSSAISRTSASIGAMRSTVKSRATCGNSAFMNAFSAAVSICGVMLSSLPERG